MRASRITIAAALAVVIVAFVAGIVLGARGAGGIRPSVMTGDGFVGQQVATLSVDGTAYGVRSSVAWRDAAGSEHDSGWPACLPMGEVKGVRFAGGIVPVDGSIAFAEVLWVDCQGR